mmetsp:Transcript_64641/g.179258  ORF Transcript_64641/g.179258 Transcript_64641/m.179258 type:complete len:362 (-) Transcript_64641:17-1102(-)
MADLDIKGPLKGGTAMLVWNGGLAIEYELGIHGTRLCPCRHHGNHWLDCGGDGRDVDTQDLRIHRALQALVGHDQLPLVQRPCVHEELSVWFLRKGRDEDVVGDNVPRLECDGAGIERRLCPSFQHVLGHSACDDLDLHLFQHLLDPFLPLEWMRVPQDPAIAGKQDHTLVWVLGPDVAGHLQSNQPSTIDHDRLRTCNGGTDLPHLLNSLLHSVPWLWHDQGHSAASRNNAHAVRQIWLAAELDDLLVRIYLGYFVKDKVHALHLEILRIWRYPLGVHVRIYQEGACGHGPLKERVAQTCRDLWDACLDRIFSCVQQARATTNHGHVRAVAAHCPPALDVPPTARTEAMRGQVGSGRCCP